MCYKASAHLDLQVYSRLYDLSKTLPFMASQQVMAAQFPAMAGNNVDFFLSIHIITMWLSVIRTYQDPKTFSTAGYLCLAYLFPSLHPACACVFG
jgi:hypothetical protein